MTFIHPFYFSLFKRISDFFLALFLVIVLSPLLLLITLIIVITSGFPVIFTQKRTGKNGVPFTIYKFRTMKKNASLLRHKYLYLNEAPAPMFKIHNDPRFVGIGKVLSLVGLDELPQLLNIMKGEMSFVGPRPLPVQEALSLPQNWKNFREQVRPGVFSEWTLLSDRHNNLKKWENSEKATLENGGIAQFVLILKMVLHVIHEAFYR